MIEKAGGPSDSRARARMARFPKTDAEGNSVRLEGPSSVVEKLAASILALVADQESQTTEILEVKPDKHRLLIGRGGDARRQMEQQFGVTINVPRQSETGPARSQVKVSGQPENVEKAKAHIQELTKEVEGETVQVPLKYHHVIADNGQFFRRLRSDHKVSVDHAGGLRTTYEPVQPTVAAGQAVARGSPLGSLLTGHAGCPAEACLHWGLRRGEAYLDPLTLLRPPRVRLLPWDVPG